MIGISAFDKFSIYENDGTDNFVFSYTINLGSSSYQIRTLELNHDKTILIVSIHNSLSFYVYTSESGSQFSLNQTINLQHQASWRPSLTSDSRYLVVGDQINSVYCIQIYTYNTATKQFDPPADPTLISVSHRI